MTTPLRQTPKSGTQSLFFNDLATPVSSRRGKFSTPGQAAAVTALWRENFSNSDLPPPPVFTLDDRLDFSPDSGFREYPLSPEVKSDPRTPVRGYGSAGKGRSDASTSYGKSWGRQDVGQGSMSLNWWSDGKSGGDQGEEKGKGSHMEDVAQAGALITLPAPREVARPEVPRSNLFSRNLDEEEWVTVYGFPPSDTNLVLREFEKCGVILKHVPGPRNANWIHILYQSRADAQKAIRKNGMQINGVLIVGVKSVDPGQRQLLTEKLNNQGFMNLPFPSPTRGSDVAPSKSAKPQYLSNGISSTLKPACAIASPEKSVVSNIMDLMFGL